MASSLKLRRDLTGEISRWCSYCSVSLLEKFSNVIDESGHCAKTSAWSRRFGFLSAGLFVTDVLGGSGTIQGKHLQLPFDRDRRWHIALGLVAGLVV